MLDVKQMEGFIFDMDGTLLDSMPMWLHLAPEYFQRHGVTYEDQVLEDLASITLRQAADLLGKKYFPDIPAEEMFQDWVTYLQYHYSQLVQTKPGVKEFLTVLNKLNKKSCVATMTDRPHAEIALKAHGIQSDFAFIKTVAEAGKNKKYPDIYLQCAAQMGLRPAQCLVFEDTYSAAVVAKKAGFAVCGVADPSCAVSPEEMRVLCDIYIQDFFEIKELFVTEENK